MQCAASQFQSRTRPPNRTGPVVLLCTGSALSKIVQQRFEDAFSDVIIVEEKPEPKTQIIRRRARLIGWGGAVSQVAAGLVARTRASRTKRRIAEIRSAHGLDKRRKRQTGPNNAASSVTSVRRYAVSSVNGTHARAILMRHNPAVVAVYGTRILKPRTLQATDAPFINYHAGMTPDYRGQHPAYWALADGRPERAGVTIHLIDQGVDTGPVISQAAVDLDTREDTIASYQFVQMATGLPMLIEAVKTARAGQLRVARLGGGSAKWRRRSKPGRGRKAGAHERSHLPPTLLQYLSNGFRRGVW